jgi:hypothetical protein
LLQLAALVRELVRLVEVEVVDDVAVGQGVLGQQADDVGPVGAGGDDGVFGSDFANGLRGCGLDTRPAVGIVDLGLVHNLEEDFLGIAVGVVGGQPAP